MTRVLVVLGLVALLAFLLTAHWAPLASWAVLWWWVGVRLYDAAQGCPSMHEFEGTLWFCQRKRGHLGRHRSGNGLRWSDAEAAPPDRLQHYVSF